MSTNNLHEKFISNAIGNGWSVQYLDNTKKNIEMRKKLSSLPMNNFFYGDDTISIPSIFIYLLNGLENAMQYELCN
jgi:hypothetical protein